ncbi:malonate transporter subunit MadL [Klebsiella pneumoniae]
MGEISVKTGNNARNGGKNSLNRLIRCVCGKKIGPDPRNFNQRVSLGRNDLLIRTFPKPAEQGVGFWNAMYIPIVVAMSANQNVVAALKGGPVALIAGLGAVVIGFLLIKPLSKIGSKSTMTRSAD